ncbi:hypothetical protein MVES1_003520 [Malassezia vespertilionis]|uniref:uncharacterized protein n=1 Tax=Malassezia vespertilionis TaxID=2020962 RepID=UPI0024B0A9D3|nr:uncharacterized protein MVES1_003520 [Malassezia vespertilionis]WFD08150.1 hypothetical protein MVES1_003520 [Malassezia vespertilionis]
MDALKAQIAAQKRKAAAQEDGAPKYMRRGEIREHASEPQRDAPEDEETAPRTPQTSQKDDTPVPENGLKRHAGFAVSIQEAVRRLRQKNEPIRLFAESDEDRRLRLRAFELNEGHKVTEHGGNDLVVALRDTDSVLALENIGERDKCKKEGAQEDSGRVPAKKREGVGMHTVLDLEMVRKEPNKAHPILYYTLKGLLGEWEEELERRPENERHSAQGRLVSATHAQTTQYLKPLFKTLRHRDIAPDVLMRIAEIVHYMQLREYQKANDSYLQLSIGNAAWPIGVTAVGIHERSGQEKLYTSNVAHVLNDEVSRKYIQSLKRLMTFAQAHYPPDDLRSDSEDLFVLIGDMLSQLMAHNDNIPLHPSDLTRFHSRATPGIRHYARVGGISLTELNLLEKEFLNVIDWRLVPMPDAFTASSKILTLS